MCRYAFSGPYKEKFACFRCRKVFKQTNRKELTQKIPTDADGKRLAPCPECGVPMRDMGLDFKAPPRTDLNQWGAVEMLAQNGITYHSCGCGPAYRPTTLDAVPIFLERRKQEQAEWKRQSENAEKAWKRDALRSEKRWERAAKWAQKKDAKA